MRWICALFLAAAATGWGQKSSDVVEYIYDLNGNRVETGYAASQTGGPSSSAIVEKGMTVNGRMAPRQSVEEKVLRDDKSMRIVERVVRRYDQNGQSGPPEKIRIEETRSPDGSSRTVETTERGDINGNMQLAERSVTQSTVNGATTTATTQVDRPGTDGAMRVVERRDTLTKKTPTGSESEISKFQPDQNGRLYEATRQVTQTNIKGAESVTSLTEYRARDGKLELEGRTLATTKNGVSVVDVYAVHAAGETRTPGALKLLEQNVVERKGNVETVSVRTTSPNNPGHLGPARKVLERVCEGDCK